jgi:hypothetical protein
MITDGHGMIPYSYRYQKTGIGNQAFFRYGTGEVGQGKDVCVEYFLYVVLSPAFQFAGINPLPCSLYKGYSLLPLNLQNTQKKVYNC